MESDFFKDVQIRNSTELDNQSLINLFLKYPVLSSLSYKVDRSPDYFNLSRVQGFDRRVLVAYRENISKSQPTNVELYQENVGNRLGDSLLGTISVIFDQVYMDGQIKKQAYMCDLRLEPEARGTGLGDKMMLAGYNTCLQVLGAEPVIFSCVLNDNKAGLKKLANLGRDKITRFEKIGEIKTYFFLPFNPKRFLIKNDYFIRCATWDDLPEMVELWNQVISKKNLGRVFTLDEFENWIKNSPGLNISSYLLAIKDNEIKGFLGIWNQFEIRKIIITAEIPFMTIVRKTWNFFKKLFNLPHFPEPGQSLNFFNVVNLCIPLKNSEILPSLINKAFKIVRENNSLFLAMALDKRDPLNENVRGFISSVSELDLLTNSKEVINNKKSNIYHMEISLG